MPQSPYIITGISTTPTTVDLGGLYRNIQAGVSLSSGSSASHGGTVKVVATDVAGYDNALSTILNRTTIDPGYTYYSSVAQGFFRYINVSTTVSSSGNVNVVLYFDGSGWPT